jgi:hypothetical protein
VTPNGLGAWWFPAPLRAWLTRKSAVFFNEASWIKHDIGYARGWPARDVCDRKFLQAMLRDASRRDRPAGSAVLALLFWVCVRGGGSLSYARDNRKRQS